MDTKNIKTLIKILEDSGLESLSYKEGEVEINLTKSAPSQRVIEKTGASEAVEASPVQKEATINSPLVGVFYSKSAPDKEAFAKPGNQVSAGDTICIVEAMKVMNEIKSDRAGIIKKVLVEDGAMVEFDQPLFVIEENI